MTWDLGSPGNVQFWGSTRWFLPTFSRGHWTSLHCFTWDPKWFSPFSMFPPGGETKKTFTKAAQTKRHGETGKPFDFWSGQILLATSRGLKPQKACTFLDGKWDPLFQGKSRWWWNIHYNLARCNVRKGRKTWGWLSWAVVSYVSHSCSVWDSQLDSQFGMY